MPVSAQGNDAPAGYSKAHQAAKLETLASVSPATSFAEKFKAIRRELRVEYLQTHAKPWIVGFSGGKDSTLLVHLIVECLLSVAPDERRRRVVILSNDTQVESPVFQTFVNKLLDHLGDSLSALRLPIEVVKTRPRVDESFWVNLLGRGYPAPSPFFRWCTDRMKVRPTSRFIRDQVSQAGEAILVLGVRRAESAQRAKNLARHDAAAKGRLTPHTDFKGCLVFTPIKDLTTEEVWISLLNSRPPWGGNYRDLLRLYQDAHAGECPFVTSTDDAPSCGTSSARFGCWTCTVIEKDRSLDSLIDAGHDQLEPLAAFRQRIKEVSDNPECRSKVRRNGQPGLGPLTIDARKLLLDELLKTQQAVGFKLISSTEERLVREQWALDTTDAALRELTKLASPPAA